MHVEIKGDEIIITIPRANPPTPSNSGKSLIVATTSGIVKTNVLINGKPLQIGVNAFVTAK